MDKIRRFRAQGQKVAILSMDASSAFDLLDHEVILRSLEVIGAGPLIQKLTNSFLKDCKNFVQIGDSQSESWTVTTGSGQGRRLSPDYFNLSCISQAILCLIAEFIGYADDGIDIVHGSTPAECDEKLQAVANERVNWYSQIGLSLNISKTQILGIGYSPARIILQGNTIHPSSDITFLGMTIQSDLKWSRQITSLCNKIRSAAGRIRYEGRNLNIWDRRALYMGWIQSLVHYNALVVLSTSSATDLSSVQTACNAGIRAVMGLKKYGYVDITSLRKSLGIQSVESIIELNLLGAAWKHFSTSSLCSPRQTTGPFTRGMAKHNIPHPDQRGHMAKAPHTILTKARNRILLEIKNANNFKSAKRLLKTFLYHQQL